MLQKRKFWIDKAKLYVNVQHNTTFAYDSFALQMQHGWCKNQVLNAFQVKKQFKISDNFAQVNWPVFSFTVLK